MNGGGKMARTFGILILLISAFAVAVAQTPASSVTITWLGQSTFVMNTSTGLKVLLDPTNPGTYNPAPMDGIDLITVSHEHGDHNYVQMATGSPLILRGLTQDGFAKIDQTIKGVRIRTVPAYHDAEKGGQRGRNALFVFEMPGLRIVHLGDLGHKLDSDQTSAIGAADIIMTPVAGGPTIDPKTATEVINQLQAKVIIPMHYATEAMAARNAARSAPAAPAGGTVSAARGPSMSTVDEFLKVLDPTIKVERAAHQITLESGKLPAQRTVMVMKYE
jgi:L-ascorbate metabolism protein UlaG (beta-lactamase superfamily)